MNNHFLETFYELVVLPNYKIFDGKKITWHDHGKVNIDSWAHYFDDGGPKQYVLVFEDFPGDSPFDDGLSHVRVDSPEGPSLKFGPGDGKFVENVTGYFTLYKEK